MTNAIAKMKPGPPGHTPAIAFGRRHLGLGRGMIMGAARWAALA